MPLITDEINEASKNDISFDYKTALQQFVQASGKERLQYICIGESGPDHNKTFEVEAKLNSNVIGVGTGKTKREAEQHAAKKALELFAVK
jgi:ribonuclease-3